MKKLMIPLAIFCLPLSNAFSNCKTFHETIQPFQKLNFRMAIIEKELGWISPTQNIGEWIGFNQNKNALRFIISSPHQQKTFHFTNTKGQYCLKNSKTLSMERPSQENTFDDEDLKRLLAKNKKGLIYIWSYYRPLSFSGLKYTQAVAKKLDLPLTILRDPNTFKTITGTISDGFSHDGITISKDEFPKLASNDLIHRNALMHFPMTYVYKDGIVLGDGLFGHMVESELERKVSNFLASPITFDCIINCQKTILSRILAPVPPLKKFKAKSIKRHRLKLDASNWWQPIPGDNKALFHLITSSNRVSGTKRTKYTYESHYFDFSNNKYFPKTRYGNESIITPDGKYSVSLHKDFDDPNYATKYFLSVDDALKGKKDLLKFKYPMLGDYHTVALLNETPTTTTYRIASDDGTDRYAFADFEIFHPEQNGGKFSYQVVSNKDQRFCKTDLYGNKMSKFGKYFSSLNSGGTSRYGKSTLRVFKSKIGGSSFDEFCREVANVGIWATKASFSFDSRYLAFTANKFLLKNSGPFTKNDAKREKEGLVYDIKTQILYHIDYPQDSKISNPAFFDVETLGYLSQPIADKKYRELVILKFDPQ